MPVRDDRMLEALEDAVVPLVINGVLPPEKGFVGGADGPHTRGEPVGNAGANSARGPGGAGFGWGFLRFHGQGKLER